MSANNTSEIRQVASSSQQKASAKQGKQQKDSSTKYYLPSRETLSSLTSIPFVDTHTHLHYVLERLESTPLRLDNYSILRDTHFPSNLEFCINVLCDPETFAGDTLFPNTFRDWRIQASEPYIYLAAGVHPHNAKVYNDYIESLMLTILQHPKTVALGEIGLDYHYDNSPRDVQQQIFIRQLKKAVELEKPIVIHTREAEQDTYDILTKHVPSHWRIHVHCFTDSPEFAKSLIEFFPNLYIGITGVVTFGSAKNTQNTLRDLPISRILLETDAPFMIPSKLNRNRRSNEKVSVCHSGMIPFIAEKIAEIKGVEIGEIMRAARENTRNMYGI
ncbi:4528_t:CDS:1 [Ambispora leptoticha]|uniref:4528_t:CDS:1 n=1 Tax=Ambispora leptoticha TaxID=144679 RepID=A0A9N9B4Q7_9GLOM|nr:4528_t:CDS:1 [Ambispora leptoticha]